MCDEFDLISCRNDAIAVGIGFAERDRAKVRGNNG